MNRLRRPHVRRLVLADFRSYRGARSAVPAGNVALTGHNGAGKTNLLEALSFLAPAAACAGRSLPIAPGRVARGGWAVSVELEHETDGESVRVQLGTGLEPADGGAASRKCRIDRVPVASARAFGDHVRVVWLTPAMDGLFVGPAAERRRFLDRIVLTVDGEHATRVAALDRALRNRNRVLEEGRQSGRLDHAWAEAAEREVAALGVAVAAARHETVARLGAIIAAERDDASPFPWAEVSLAGHGRSAGRQRSRARGRGDLPDAAARGARARRRGRTHVHRPAPVATCWSGTVPRMPMRRAPRPESRRPCWSAWCWRRPGSSAP